MKTVVFVMTVVVWRIGHGGGHTGAQTGAHGGGQIGAQGNILRFGKFWKSRIMALFIPSDHETRV